MRLETERYLLRSNSFSRALICAAVKAVRGRFLERSSEPLAPSVEASSPPPLAPSYTRGMISRIATLFGRFSQKYIALPVLLLPPFHCCYWSIPQLLRRDLKCEIGALKAACNRTLARILGRLSSPLSSPLFFRRPENWPIYWATDRPTPLALLCPFGCLIYSSPPLRCLHLNGPCLNAKEK